MWVDVVTAAHAEHADFLNAAWRSLRDQTHQRWTWLVQIDGEHHMALDTLSRAGALKDPRVRVGVNRSDEGAAVTRNVALGRGRAPLAQNLDADDELEPNGLTSLVAALSRHPAAGFAVGHARDLLPDGQLTRHPLPVPVGALPRGCLLAAWDPPRVPVHPAGVMWRRILLLFLGGWSALGRMEDTGVLMAASAMAEGVMVDEHILRYRKHRGQRSTRPSKFSGGGRRFRWYGSGPRFSALGQIGGRLPAATYHRMRIFLSQAPTPDSGGQASVAGRAMAGREVFAPPSRQRQRSISPRMNFSTRSRASLSTCCSGGDFMK